MAEYNVSSSEVMVLFRGLEQEETVLNTQDNDLSDKEKKYWSFV